MLDKYVYTKSPQHQPSGESVGHIMDFCCIREVSKKLFGMYLKRGKIVFLKK